MKNSVKAVVAPYGIYLGIALSLITVLAYVFNLDLFTKWWLGIINLLLVIIIAIFAVRKAKQLSTTDYFSFKSAFSAYFIPVAIGLFIATLVSVLLFNIIDPGAADAVKEKTIEVARNMMEKFGAPESEVNKAIAKMDESSQFSVMNLLKAYVYQLAFHAVIALIIALIFREKDPSKN